jgi:glycosyltransferase involved in cell wall biosynthesis
MKDIYLTVVIPCFNEERNIRIGALEKVNHFLTNQNFNYEIIIVDDGSTDESISLLKKFTKEHKNTKSIFNQHQGKAATVITGILAANGKYILFTDLDQATPIEELKKLLLYMNKGFDIAIGSRNDKRKGAPLFRVAMAKGFIILRNLILNLGIKDTQCGFKLFSEKSAKIIFKKLKLFKVNKHAGGSTVTAGFDVEVLYVAKRNKLKIAEVPVEWHYQETRRVNPIYDSVNGFIDLIRIRINGLIGEYNN